MWKPITREKLFALISEELAECPDPVADTFRRFRVEPFHAPITRHGRDTDQVFVVARRGNEVMYYEDIEEGWNFSPISDDGRVLEHWCNQDELRFALLHWSEKTS